MSRARAPLVTAILTVINADRTTYNSLFLRQRT